jgi:hypothetical protein
MFEQDESIAFLNHQVTWGLWLIASVYWAAWIKTGGYSNLSFGATGYGHLSKWYVYYLCGQGLHALCRLADVPSIADHCLIWTAYAYYGCGVVAWEYGIACTIDAPTWMEQLDAARSSQVIKTTLKMAKAAGLATHVLILVVQCTAGYGNTDDGDGTLMAMVFNFPATVAGVATLAFFWHSEKTDATLKDELWWGMVGGLFSFFNLIMPSFSFLLLDIFSPILRSVADSFLYIPLIATTVVLIDGRIEVGPSTSRFGKRTPNRRQPVETLEQRNEWRSSMWFNIKVLLVALAALKIGVVITDVLYVEDMCFDPVDLSNHPENCAEGALLLGNLDPHTKAVYGLMKRTRRGKTRPTGDAILVPSQVYGKRKMLNIPLLNGVQIPAWDEDNPSQGIAAKVVPLIFGYLNTPAFNPLVDKLFDFEDINKGQVGLFWAFVHVGMRFCKCHLKLACNQTACIGFCGSVCALSLLLNAPLYDIHLVYCRLL